MKNLVSLKYVEDYSYEEVEQGITDALDLVGGMSKFVKPKMKVMLKCSLGEKHEPDDALTTHPSVVKVVAGIVAKLGASCVIVDCPTRLNTTISKIYETTQMLDASNAGDAELNSNYNVYKLDFEGKVTKKLTLIDAINDVDVIINMPKLVVDASYGLKGCLDNLFGLVPTEEKVIVKSRLFTLEDYNQYLLDLYKYLQDKVVLNIVDGIVSHESNNSQRIMNAIIIGEDPFAVDYTILKILDQDSQNNVLLNLAIENKFINQNETINVVGDKVETFIKPDFSYPIVDKETLFEKKSKAENKYKTYQARPNIITSKCKGCGVCIKTCPNQAISAKYDKNNEIYADLDYSKCISCFRCVRACPYQVIDTITPHKNKKLNTRMNKRLTDSKEEKG